MIRQSVLAPLRRLPGFFSTSVGKKAVVAVTGIALIGFLVGHLLGNLLVFQGRDTLNSYAAWLKSSPLLWIARTGLLAIFGVHVGNAISLARENRKARPQRYVLPIASRGLRASSRFMVLTGLTVLAFVVFHLLHFTLGVVDPEGHRLVDEQGRHDVYGMVLHSFGNPWIVTSYVIAMVLLGVHLRHGALSVMQTLGLGGSTWAQFTRLATYGLVAALVLGNVALPILIALGAARGDS